MKTLLLIPLLFAFSTLAQPVPNMSSGTVEPWRVPMTDGKGGVGWSSTFTGPNDRLFNVSSGTTIFVDPTNGNNSWSGSYERPKRTLVAANAAASAGNTIYAFPGFYNLGTNQILLVRGGGGVNLVGPSSNSVIIEGWSDLAGTEGGFVVTGGPQIVPGNNSITAGFTVRCNTNVLNIMAATNGHSGTWAGLGTSFLNPPGNTPFTNHTTIGVHVERSYFDSYHSNHTNRMGWTIRGSTYEANGGGFNFVCSGVIHLNNYWSLIDCGGRSRSTYPAGVTPQWPPGFLASSDLVYVQNCTGIIEQDTGAVPAQMFTFDVTGLGKVHVAGGSFRSVNLADTYNFQDQATAWGWCQYNGTNYTKPVAGSLTFGDASGLTNLNAASLSGTLANNLLPTNYFGVIRKTTLQNGVDFPTGTQTPITNYQTSRVNGFTAGIVAGSLTNTFAGLYLLRGVTYIGAATLDTFAGHICTNGVSVWTDGQAATSLSDGFSGPLYMETVLDLPAGTRIDIRVDTVAGNVGAGIQSSYLYIGKP